MKRVGLIINPTAGMGGRVGLKGTDGKEILAEAIRRGSTPRAEKRAADALRRLTARYDELELLTCTGAMGETAARGCGQQTTVVYSASGETSADDTRRAAGRMVQAGIDLLLFAGGDGTACDIYDAVGAEVVVLGIPAGVKIHSAIYAASPVVAGELAASYLRSQTRVVEAEVMDLDEEAYRAGHVAARLYGYLRVPFHESYLQTAKARSSCNEQAAQRAIAEEILAGLAPDCYYVIGPGTTTRAIMDLLGLGSSLLGIDLLRGRELVCRDLNEKELLARLAGTRFKIIITPIGGQGYLIGRGNQQISPAILRTAGPRNLIVAATQEKMQALLGRPMLIDSGDLEIDSMFAGYVRVVTGQAQTMVYRLACAAQPDSQ